MHLRLPPADVPGPRGLPLLDPPRSVLQFFADPVGRMLDLHRRFGSIAALVENNPAVVLAFGAARNQEVLTQPAIFRHAESIPVRSPEGSSLARFNRVLPFTNGEAHKRRRRLLQPAFQRSALEGYIDDTERIAETMVSKWPHDTPLDLVGLCRSLTAAITVKTIFGTSTGDPGEDLAALETTLLDALSSLSSLVLPFDVPGLPFHVAMNTATRLEAALRRLIAERRKNPSQGRDALSILLQARDENGETLSDDELVPECNGLFVAGHDTAAVTLSWTLLLLERHPKVLKDVLDEVDVLPKGPAPEGGPVDLALRESMRVLPAAPMLFMRELSEDAPLGSFHLPKGATVILSPLVTHRDPERFPDPDRFRPSRWTTIRPSIYEYLPFGAGARMCLGAALANQMLRIVLPAILRRGVPRLKEGARISRAVRGIALSPRNGMPITWMPRGKALPEPARITGDIGEIVRWGD